MTDKFEVPEVSAVDIAFGTTKALPKYDSLDDEFKRRRAVECNLFSQVFFHGNIDGFTLSPRDDVDPEKAWGAVMAHMVSFEPKHEHKEAGVSWMIRQWFIVERLSSEDRDATQ